jgi:hypothetical protein
MKTIELFHWMYVDEHGKRRRSTYLMTRETALAKDPLATPIESTRHVTCGATDTAEIVSMMQPSNKPMCK